MARATFDNSTAVNYELACGEVDSVVNMQNREVRPGSIQHECQTPTLPAHSARCDTGCQKCQSSEHGLTPE
ncbi:uncharacterized [Tachysurus ichikawai]